jgi:hypothetical protein
VGPSNWKKIALLEIIKISLNKDKIGGSIISFWNLPIYMVEVPLNVLLVHFL